MLLLVSGGLILLLLAGFATPLVLGAILATISYPLYKKIKERLRNRKTLAALLVLLLLILIIILPFFGIVTLLWQETSNLVTVVQGELSSSRPFGGTLDKLSTGLGVDVRDLITNEILPNVQNLGTFLADQIRNILSNAINLVISFFVLMVTTFYLLRDGDILGNFLKRVSPLKERDNERFFVVFEETGRAVFFGNFVSAIAQGFLGGLGFLFAGLESPIFWGTIMAFIALIPLLGPYIISIPAAIYLFLAGRPGVAIAFLLYNLLVVSTVDNIIKPKLIGDKIRIHPLFILIIILGGIKIFGIVGVIYGPLIAAIFMSIISALEENAKLKTIA